MSRRYTALQQLTSTYFAVTFSVTASSQEQQREDCISMAHAHWLGLYTAQDISTENSSLTWSVYHIVFVQL